ncbi:hypothetical protein [Microbacterium sp. EST19A]|uniref:hypothetical protein n=1 Tax=Microbacterium sp. EST19A TaxID=2862681 RepID=UPI001CBB514C|nr:hypothetical protein [Microbacterium sp. EST19A]
MAVNLELLPNFVARCDTIGTTPPKAITRALELLRVVRAHQETPTVSVLGLTDKQARDRVTDVSIRRHSTGMYGDVGMVPGISDFEMQLAEEVTAAVLPDLDDMVAGLQDKFAELSRPFVVAAQEYGFTVRTTSDQVINMVDEEASAAWRGSQKAWKDIAPIVAFRIEVSKLFEVSPTPDDMGWNPFNQALGDSTVNFSVAFAAGENWSLDGGYYIEGKTIGHLDWLALAAGGLRLNTPSEVAAKIAARPSRGIPPLDEHLAALSEDVVRRV